MKIIRYSYSPKVLVPTDSPVWVVSTATSLVKRAQGWLTDGIELEG
jgi:hypothetical protein